MMPLPNARTCARAQPSPPCAVRALRTPLPRTAPSSAALILHCSANFDGDATTPAFKRREAAAMMAAAVTTCVPGAHAKAPGGDEDLWRFDWDTGVVRPSLSAQEYLERLKRAVPTARAALYDLVSNDEYKRAQDSLLVGSFDEVRQSLFYLPWAFRDAGDDLSAARQSDAYREVKQSAEALDAALGAAASFEAEREDVLAALDSFWTAVAKFQETASSWENP